MFIVSGEPLNKNFLEVGNFKIAWYAVLIFLGAFLSFKLSQYFGKKRGINPETYTDIFFICFPLGLVGARLWYVCSNLASMWNNASFLFNTFDSVPKIFNFLANVIAVWEGGLAVQGGVVLGVVSGYFYWKKHKPCSSFFDLLDTVAPNILIGQIIGRWGNFFNGEVFGACVDPQKLSWLPNFILNQQIYATDIYFTCQGLAAQPLFLYEGLLNLAGLILITFVLRKYWIKNRCYGDLSALYFLWYGVVRISLEGLRNPMFIMKMFGLSTSIWFSALFIIAGISWLILNRYLVMKKGVTSLVYDDSVAPFVKVKEEKNDAK